MAVRPIGSARAKLPDHEPLVAAAVRAVMSFWLPEDSSPQVSPESGERPDPFNGFAENPALIGLVEKVHLVAHHTLPDRRLPRSLGPLRRRRVRCRLALREFQRTLWYGPPGLGVCIGFSSETLRDSAGLGVRWGNGVLRWDTVTVMDRPLLLLGRIVYLPEDGM
jgi:hypothetical protein